MEEKVDINPYQGENNALKTESLVATTKSLF
jgi:hypothetical protein